MVPRFVESIRLVTGAAERGSFRVALIGGLALPFFGVERATADVDFLVEHSGADLLHRALTLARMRCLKRNDDVANYDAGDPTFASIDVLYARRPATLRMLERARIESVIGTDLGIAVVDAEGIIGLKVQAIANDPKREFRDKDDILHLLTLHADRLDLELVREYFRVFDMETELEALLELARGD